MRLLATIQDCPIVENEDGTVTYLAKAAIDADGAGGNPFHDKYFQPQTSLRHEDGTSLNALTERYVVVPPAIIRGVKPVVLGCQARVRYRGTSVTAVVADIGPAAKLGEISVALAKALGIPDSPVSGGVEEHVVYYVLSPGVAACVDGRRYKLQPAGKALG